MHNSPPPVSILSHIDAVHAPPPHPRIQPLEVISLVISWNSSPFIGVFRNTVSEISRCVAWLKKRGGMDSFNRVFTRIHSSEKAGVLFRKDALYGII
jgi:hypothetical protein